MVAGEIPFTIMLLIKHMDAGGGELVFRSVAQGLDSRVFRPIVVCLEHKGVYGEELESQGYTVYSRILKRQLDLFVLWRLFSIIRKENVSLIYMMDYRDVMLWGSLAGWMAKVPTILTSHCTSWWNVIHPTMIGTWFFPLLSRVVTIAEFQREYFVKKRKVNPEKVTVIPNGVDTDLFRKSGHIPQDLAQKYTSDTLIVGMISALRPGKNIKMFLDAAEMVLRDNRDVKFLIVGDGPDRQKHEKYTSQRGLQDNVQFLGMRKDVPGILNRLDVFVLASDFEVMPLSVLEAMSVGVPVISTRVGSVEELVEDGGDGFVVDVNNTEQLAQRLKQLLCSKELRDSFGKAGPQKVKRNYSLQKMVHRTEQVFKELVELNQANRK